MPTEAIRRKLAEQEQQEILAREARDKAKLQAEHDRAISLQKDALEKAQLRAENDKVIEDSGILAGLEKIKSGLIKEKHKRVQLYINESANYLALVWGNHYDLSSGRVDGETYRTFLGGVKYSQDFNCIEIEIGAIYDKPRTIRSLRSGVFPMENWGDENKVDEWLAEDYLKCITRPGSEKTRYRDDEAFNYESRFRYEQPGG